MKAITLIILGFIFVLSFIGVVFGAIDMGAQGVVVPVIATAVSGYLLGKVFYADHQLESLRSFLLENRAALEAGELRYKGLPITADTEVFRYLFAVSVGFVSIKTPSQFYFSNNSHQALLGLWHTLLSLIFGWWGIPWGPIFTVQAVRFNSKGGQCMTLHEVMFFRGP